MSAYDVRRIFTFGHGQRHFPGYVIVHGLTDAECRARMIAAFGRQWSMEYLDEASAGVEQFGLRLVAEIGKDDEAHALADQAAAASEAEAADGAYGEWEASRHA